MMKNKYWEEFEKATFWENALKLLGYMIITAFGMAIFLFIFFVTYAILYRIFG